ncbi:MAG: thiamine phosphate synthase [Nitrospirae bacterium]|nr:thiamine phosphate synthase [Nitrospirota bacterium]MCL5236287.1 thiamine phosphate synthase [Nitrospirota bacterium]
MNKAHHRFSPICFITGASPACNLESAVSILLESGIRWIQYREKNKTKRDLFYEALKLREITRKYNACFIVNDHADIALAVDADGVHLGQDDLPLAEARKIMGDRIVGISTHALQEALSAETGGADYIGFGPVFHTATKDAGEPKGVDILKHIRASVKIPVIAIGGIKADTIQSVLGAGGSGVAVSSGLLQGDMKENAQRFLSMAASVLP